MRRKTFDERFATEFKYWYAEGARRLAVLEARLAQLECPKHSYKSEVCVKCGKERD